MLGQLAGGDVHSPQTASCASGIDSEQEVPHAVLVRLGGGGLVVDVSGRKVLPPTSMGIGLSLDLDQPDGVMPPAS